MQRRKFIYILIFGSLGIVTANSLNEFKNKYIYSLSNDQKKIIKDYNEKRFKSLQNNLEANLLQNDKLLSFLFPKQVIFQMVDSFSNIPSGNPRGSGRLFLLPSSSD